MQWPASELEFWSLCFSIDYDARSGNATKPKSFEKTPETVTLEESKQSLRELLDG